MGNFFYRIAICDEYCTEDEYSFEYRTRSFGVIVISDDNSEVWRDDNSVELDILDLYSDSNSNSSTDLNVGMVIECEISEDEITLVDITE